jgi:Holliday junction resolvasome RuvABC endonuclease subunit
MKVIALDPSLTATGMAALDFQARRVIAWDCVRTKPDNGVGRKTDDLARRVSEVFQGVADFIEANRGALAIEAQVASSFSSRKIKGMASMKNVGMLMAGYSACICAGAMYGKKPILVMPATVKHRVTGHKGASKQEAWNHAAKHFTSLPPLPSSKVPREAVQDAVAVGLAALPEMQQIVDFKG